MGKIPRMRQKYRAFKAKETSSGSVIPDDGSASVPRSLVDQLFTPETLTNVPKITSSLLKNQFAEFEERNTIATTLSAKSSIYAGMKKKTKKDLRHQLWLKKLEVTESAKKEAADKKRREATAVIGDIQPMSEALTDLSSFLKDISDTRDAARQQRKAAFKPILKQKARAKEQNQNIAVMKAVLDNPEFKQNPLLAMREHLKQRFGSS